MKTNNKTIFALSLFAFVAGSTHATSQEIQEKLASGICNYNQEAIVEAITAGANPFICHKTELVRSNLKAESPMGEAIAAIEKLSPYYIVLQTPQRVILGEAAARQAILNTTETLLKMGVSVDTEPSNPSCGIGYTFRQQIDLSLEELEDLPENPNYVLTNEQKDQLAQTAHLMRDLLTLMRKYQPEPTGFEYASSFRFAV